MSEPLFFLADQAGLFREVDTIIPHRVHYSRVQSRPVEAYSPLTGPRRPGRWTSNEETRVLILSEGLAALFASPRAARSFAIYCALCSTGPSSLGVLPPFNNIGSPPVGRRGEREATAKPAAEIRHDTRRD